MKKTYHAPEFIEHSFECARDVLTSSGENGIFGNELPIFWE